MPLYEFKEGDVLRNTLKAYPSNYFIITSGSILYNNINPELRTLDAGSSNYILHIPTGSISLYELNVDRSSGDLIYPFIVKGGSLSSFKSTTTRGFQSTNYGTELSPLNEKYPLSSSINYTFYSSSDSAAQKKEIYALKNTLNFYKTQSSHYDFGNKGAQDLTLINIPSIFYGSSMKKGTVSLKYYYTGSFVGEIKDTGRNGELRQVSPSGEAGEVAGIVLYNEGFIILTGSWDLNSHQDYHTSDASLVDSSWKYWGARSQSTLSSSWTLEFDGTTHTQVMTMFAKAPRGELNFSNNPTFAKHFTGSASELSERIPSSGSNFYIENPQVELTNLVSSSYTEPSASFRKQTYISKVGIFDKDNNLIAVAKVATPVKKTEQREYTFKLKLDI